MKVLKIADVINNLIMFCSGRGWKQGDIASLLTQCEPVKHPNPNYGWQLEIEVGEGDAARVVPLDLPYLISFDDVLDRPLFLTGNKLVFFQNRLFMPERPPRTDAEREEIVLRVKKMVYDEQAELVNLKAAVSNLEAAIEYTKSGFKRDPIPEDVKLLVWARDGGECMRCGSKTNLHFDHIIPVAKGGGNSEANIQILCQPCNLRKSDKIANL